MDPVRVNDYTCGSAGKGFYHDFTSGQEWTAERGWHLFSPQPPRGIGAFLKIGSGASLPGTLV